ncbi:MAG: 23S ribosomal RNA methyltransferase Erm [Prevotellaceae bacterium]|jgi:23S rRNA (adenine-N6)-dimethyltransferase|nr:23S ribosomal RNA methyltransferase Erm [Prevotellaceae bacterium]
MTKNKLPVRFTGQHFTIDNALIVDAIRITEIKKHDIVLDIGAGKGFLTVHLARQCNNVVAIENDKFLLDFLRKKFSKKSNVKIIDADFRNYTIPNIGFKVVSSIPYGITSCVLKSLMFDNVANFMGGSLIMQFEPVQKLFSEKIFNPYIIFYHTFFDLTLMYEVAPKSFMPPPKVKSALLRIAKKEPPISAKLKEKYLNFLFYMLQKPDLPVKTVLKKLFRKNQVREISENYGISLNCQVVNMSASQWSACFLEMLDKIPERHHPTK